MNRKNMQPSAYCWCQIVPKPANLGQGLSGNGNPPVQGNEGVPRLSPIRTSEVFPYLREPAASTNDIHTTSPSMNSHCNDFERACYPRPQNRWWPCIFCQSVWPSKPSLLAHLRKHSKDPSRGINLLLKELASRTSVRGFGIDGTPIVTPREQNRSNVILERTRNLQWPRAWCRSRMPDPRVQRTYMTGSSDDVGLPSGNASLIRKLHNYARSADQNKQRYVPPKHAGVVFRESSAGPSSQNTTAVGVERCGTALTNERTNQRPALREMVHSNDGGRGCAPNIEEQPTQDEMTCAPSPTSCTESTWRESSKSDAFPRAVLESSDGGVANIETNHDQEDRCTSFVEDTTSDGRSALCCEPEVRPESAPKNPPALPFSVKPVLDLDRVVKQERDAVLISCDSDTAEEGREGELGNDNHFEPPSGQCAADPASRGNVVLNGSPDRASSAGIVSNESTERYSKVHIPNNREPPPSTPSDVHAKGGSRKRRISSCDRVGDDAKTTRRSEHAHERSFDKGKSSAAPASVSESDYGPDTSGHEHNKAAIRRPLQYDPNDNGAPSQDAANGTACQKSAQAQPSSKEDEAAPTPQSRGCSTKTCPSCSKVLASRSSLYQHRRLVHDRLRPLKCPHCDKAFGLKRSLQDHIRALHTRERPFECPHCTRRLSSSSSLSKHRLVHVDDRPHKCASCGKRYRGLRTLENHARSKHPTDVCVV